MGRVKESYTPPSMRPYEPSPESEIFWPSNLQFLVENSGLTQADVARRAGVQRDSFNRYMLGKTRPPAPKLIAIARALGVKPSEIDRDRPELDRASPVLEAAPVAYRLTPSRTGDPGIVHLELSLELPVGTATEILQMIAKAGTGASP